MALDLGLEPEPGAIAGPARLQGVDPAGLAVSPDWQDLLQRYWAGTQGQSLAARLGLRLTEGACIYPPQPLRALELTPRADVRVVILGQDPYHGPGQGEGLAFSVASGIAIPPSLRNIRLELAQDPALAPWATPVSGSLESWARQGVLLLNTCLTVEDGKPASQSGWGWEALTDMIFAELVAGDRPLVFMLWGAHAQKVGQRAGLRVGWPDVATPKASEAMAGAGRHRVLAANHPSPLSARRGPVPFLGCRHFSLANEFLIAQGLPAIRW